MHEEDEVNKEAIDNLIKTEKQYIMDLFYKALTSADNSNTRRSFYFNDMFYITTSVLNAIVQNQDIDKFQPTNVVFENIDHPENFTVYSNNSFQASLSNIRKYIKKLGKINHMFITFDGTLRSLDVEVLKVAQELKIKFSLLRTMFDRRLNEVEKDMERLVSEEDIKGIIRQEKEVMSQYDHSIRAILNKNEIYFISNVCLEHVLLNYNTPKYLQKQHYVAEEHNFLKFLTSKSWFKSDENDQNKDIEEANEVTEEYDDGWALREESNSSEKQESNSDLVPDHADSDQILQESRISVLDQFSEPDGRL
uniref:DH domain-containing protein n=1 Tax=Acrobeloides nanus TaxID=290746 RepID=A0A914BYX9_9BILA